MATIKEIYALKGKSISSYWDSAYPPAEGCQQLGAQIKKMRLDQTLINAMTNQKLLDYLRTLKKSSHENLIELHDLRVKCQQYFENIIPIKEKAYLELGCSSSVTQSTQTTATPSGTQAQAQEVLIPATASETSFFTESTKKQLPYVIGGISITIVALYLIFKK